MRCPENNRGFTLVEILVVMAIIVTLATVVFASASMARESARDARRVAQINEISNALLLFRDTNGSYPSTTPDGYTGEDAAIRFLVAEHPGYLSFVPPASGPDTRPYIYRGLQEDGSECLSAVDICSGFVLGVTLERESAPSLSGDADTIVGAGFFGASDDCLTAPTSAPEQCYDVKAN